jgi:predicted RNA-binding Zn ribbon-like protein
MGDWVWDGGRPSVDLLNTIRERALSPRETLRTPADLAMWLREAGLPGDPDEDDLNAARRLRDAIDTLTAPAAEAGVPSSPGRPDAVAVINAAADTPVAPRLGLDAQGRTVAVAPASSAAVALARIALDAIDLLTGGELLRVCAADDCGIRFVDRSPARNRQWCSMRRCGNRTKARRHYSRARR